MKRLFKVVIILFVILLTFSFIIYARKDTRDNLYINNEKSIIHAETITKLTVPQEFSESFEFLDSDSFKLSLKDDMRVLTIVIHIEENSGEIRKEDDEYKIILKGLKEWKPQNIGTITLLGEDVDLFDFKEAKPAASEDLNRARYNSILIKGISIKKQSRGYYIPMVLEKIGILNGSLLDKNIKDNLLFVNRYNPLADGYVPKNLINIKEERILLSGRVQRLTFDAADALYNLLEGAKKDGLTGFILNSSYRSIKEQQDIFDSRLSINKRQKVKNPYFETQKRVAIPGASEHHTGLCLDILSKTGNMGSVFAKTEHSSWLKDNCWDYGFIIRYPEDKQEITQVMYEPWHIRYVGYPYSLIFRDENLSHEEFVEQMRKGRVKKFKHENKTYIMHHLCKIDKVALDKGLDIDYEISEMTQDEYIMTLIY